MSDTEFERLKLLLDYTIFHIGLYATLITGLIALLALGNDNLEPYHVFPLKITAVFFVIAGAAGGVIGSNIPKHSAFSSFWEESIGFWSIPFMPAKYWAFLEHFTFWLGIANAMVSMLWGSNYFLNTWFPPNGCK